jgi:hypothetical protein
MSTYKQKHELYEYTFQQTEFTLGTNMPPKLHDHGLST